MKPTEVSNDITVIELAEELDLTVYTPACLAQTEDTTAFDGENICPSVYKLFLMFLSPCRLSIINIDNKSLSSFQTSD